MDKQNSSAGLYLQLVSDLYCDIAQCYSVSSTTKRVELGVIRARFGQEGLGFLTGALPKLGKALDRAISSGVRFAAPGWKTQAGSTTPKFLGWLINRVLDDNGLELEQPDPVALKHFRQLVFFLYKLEIPYGEAKTQKVLDSFIASEAEIGSLNWESIEADGARWLDDARDSVTNVIGRIDPTSIKPRHGPGAVATGEDAVGKSFLTRIYKKLEQVYPFMEYMRYNLNHVALSWEADQGSLELVERATAKVVFVPKDSRGPRLISSEPLEIQWIQQGLARVIQDTIERSRYANGRVNFTSQEVNRRLALIGSLHSEWVTLDMKEASDRVSTKLVERLFSGHPVLLQALLACRSEATLLPNGTEVVLQKFAPMGSAVCFPVESLIFWALSVSAIRQTGRSERYARSSVYVYGDDIIVRREDYPTLLSMLPKVGLMFNQDKCCTARFFRESCGCDAYRGVDVTPVRLKTPWSSRRSDPGALESYTALHNAMYGLAHHKTAETIKQLVTETYGYIPHTNSYSVSSNGAYCSQANAVAFVCHEPVSQANHQLENEMRPKGRVRPSCNEKSSGTSNPHPLGCGDDDARHTTRNGLRRHCKVRYNRHLQCLEYHSYRSVPDTDTQGNLRGPGVYYVEMLRKYASARDISLPASARDNHPLNVGFSPPCGVYALARRNRLKRAWLRG